MRVKLLPVLGLLLPVCASAVAQGQRQVIETKSREALRGLEAVRVVVETTPFAEKKGVAAARIEAGAVERLSQAGLRVLSGEEAQGAKGQPVFFVRVMLIDTGKGYSFTVDTQLREVVRRARAPEPELTAATWQTDAYGILAPFTPDLIVEAITSSVYSFVKEWRAANAR